MQCQIIHKRSLSINIFPLATQFHIYFAQHSVFINSILCEWKPSPWLWNLHWTSFEALLCTALLESWISSTNLAEECNDILRTLEHGISSCQQVLGNPVNISCSTLAKNVFKIWYFCSFLTRSDWCMISTFWSEVSVPKLKWNGN